MALDTTVSLTLWSAAEPAVTIMAASLPMMRVLIQTFRNIKRSDDVMSKTESVGRVGSSLHSKAEV